MSLISIENILEPFTNKVHLVTIVLVAAVFAILRLQGGGFSFQTEVTTPVLHKASKTARTPAKVAVPVQQKMAPRPQAVPQKGYLERIMERDAKTKNDPAPAEPQKQDDSGLGDIERQLGLR